MVNQRLALVLSVAALAVLSASNAHALTAYTPDAQDTCRSAGQSRCMKSVAGHQVGAFALADVAGDKEATCSMKKCVGSHSGKSCPVMKVAEVLTSPLILVGAVLNDAYLIATMPYRPSESLN